MSGRDFTVHITFYEEGSERHLHGLDHACPPRIGDRVWLTTDGTPACWEAVAVVWNYTHPSSHNGVRGLLGGMVDVLVRPSQGIFAPVPPSPEGSDEP